MKPDKLLVFEKELWKQGHNHIAGIDEVGRGALAGPMVVCAVILDKKKLPDFNKLTKEQEPYKWIKDSKLVTPRRRRIISSYLHNELYSYSIVEVPHNVLDELGLVKSTQQAFSEAIYKLRSKPHHIITDSYEVPNIARRSQTNLRRGDNKSMTVAAASIIAKVYRDDLMVKLHEEHDKYKVYGFHKHKGYGTEYHRKMIRKHGYSDIHRLSFKLK